MTTFQTKIRRMITATVAIMGLIVMAGAADRFDWKLSTQAIVAFAILITATILDLVWKAITHDTSDDRDSEGR